MPFIDAQNFIKEIAPNNEMRRSLYEFENARAIKSISKVWALILNFMNLSSPSFILKLKLLLRSRQSCLMNF